MPPQASNPAPHDDDFANEDFANEDFAYDVFISYSHADRA